MVTAIILIKAERGAVETAAQGLLKIKGITEVYSVAGEFDIVAVARVRQNEDLASLVTEEMRSTATSTWQPCSTWSNPRKERGHPAYGCPRLHSSCRTIGPPKSEATGLLRGVRAAAGLGGLVCRRLARNRAGLGLLAALALAFALAGRLIAAGALALTLALAGGLGSLLLARAVDFAAGLGSVFLTAVSLGATALFRRATCLVGVSRADLLAPIRLAGRRLALVGQGDERSQREHSNDYSGLDQIHPILLVY
jgi:hypothetical protein